MRRPHLAFRLVWLVATASAWIAALYVAALPMAHPDVVRHHPRPWAAMLAGAVVFAAWVTEANFHPGWKPLARLRAPLVGLTMSTIVSLGAAEILVRVVDPLGISYHAEMSRYILDRIPDPDLKCRHRPGFEAAYQGATMRFNDLGLRDDPVGAKSPGELRILLLGDSQTLGWGVRHEDTWGAQLQGILAQRLRRPVRVVNAGCAGYESRQEYRYLERDGWKLGPDVVLLLYLNNDIEIDDRPYDPWGEHSLRGKPPWRVLELLAKRTRLYQLAYHAREMAVVATSAKFDPKREGVLWDYDESMPAKPGWRESMKAVTGMARGAKARNARFAVVHFVWLTSPFSEALDRAVQEAASPFPVTYSAPWFADQDVRRYFNSRTDSHPNPAGHRLMAERIAEFLVKSGVAGPRASD